MASSDSTGDQHFLQFDARRLTISQHEASKERLDEGARTVSTPPPHVDSYLFSTQAFPPDLVRIPTPPRAPTPTLTPNPAARSFRPSLSGQIPSFQRLPPIPSGSRPPSRPASRASVSRLSIVTNAEDELANTGSMKDVSTKSSKHTTEPVTTKSSNGSQEIASGTYKAPGVANNEDFPALPSPSTPVARSLAAPKVTTVPKRVSTPSAAKPKAPEKALGKVPEMAAETAAIEKPDATRKAPSKDSANQEARKPATTAGLSIPAAYATAQVKITTESTITPVESAGESSSSTPVSSAAPGLPDTNPDITSTASTKPLVGHRTLRLVTATATFKSESSAPIATAITNSPIVRGRGRSETPASEAASETASIASATISTSRTSSPQPQIQATTSLRRKERRKEAERIAATRKEEQPEHLPVVGRKRKQKKWEKQAAEKPDKICDDELGLSSEKADNNITQAKEFLKPAESSKGAAKESAKEKMDESSKKKSKGKGKEDVPPPPPPAAEQPKKTPAPVPAPERPFEQQPPTPSQWQVKKILGLTPADLDKPGIKTLFSYLERAPPSTAKSSLTLDVKPAADTVSNPPITPDITADAIRILKTGMPVRIESKDSRNRPMLITPFGNALSGLSPEQERRYLELQSNLARHHCPHRHAQHTHNTHAHQSNSGEPMRAVFSSLPIEQYVLKVGRLNTVTAEYSSCGGFEVPASYNMKLRADDALQFVNQYVIPKLNLGPICKTDVGEVPGMEDVVGALNDEVITSLFCVLNRHAAHARNFAAMNDEERPKCKCPDLHPYISEIIEDGDAKTVRLLKFIFGPAIIDKEARISASSLMSALIPPLEDVEKQLVEARKDLERREKALVRAVKNTYRSLFFGSDEQPEGRGGGAGD